MKANDNSIVLMTNDDVIEMQEEYPGDKQILELTAAYNTACDDYPDCAFFFTFT